MTTGSSSAQSNEAAISRTESAPTGSAPTESAGTNEPVDAAYGDPTGELVRAAVADRPLVDIAHLITLLEQSPEYAEATMAALRAAGVGRTVEDVTRLVALLTRPPRDAASADEAIRAAAECRPVAEVTRLLELLHRRPLEPHCGEAAVRAAAAGRSVEELVDLIGRLAQERQARADQPEPESAPPAEGAEERPEADGDPLPVREARRIARTAQPRRYRVADRAPSPAYGPAWLVVLALAVCGALSFPLHRNGESVRVYGFALAVSAGCVLLALVLTIRPAAPMLVAAVVLPAAVAAAQLLEEKVRSAGLSRALDLMLAPASLVGPVAVCASLTALTALIARLAWQRPTDAPARPMAEANRTADWSGDRNGSDVPRTTALSSRPDVLRACPADHAADAG
ncbi:hypothetical protein [Streptomyces sp. NL15-2K]|uniref:hypothetical protein n=1 Tax=Streptomyces sp. NL15-2K TaxID=376149 RepID=UPI000FFAFD37|nr:MULTISPECIES: hypothetical protein [Actinomycetes]WKX06412.1 hypothetical protein Q4V64_02470 [Kutzneria buriramensis]GCB43412.1 hypothetical protein SNL152K_697 [Streptomyces sp. NL15-2K]